MAGDLRDRRWRNGRLWVCYHVLPDVPDLERYVIAITLSSSPFCVNSW
jgi:hypothetical protein